MDEVDNFEAFLHDMVAIDILDEVQTVWLYQLDHVSLKFFPFSCKFYGFLNHPASVTVLWKLQNVFFDNRKQSFSMLSLSSLEYLLEHIVAKFILGKFNTLLYQCLKNCTFGIGFSALYDWLNSSRSVLVSGPLGSLF